MADGKYGWLQQWETQAQSPAAPYGLQQAAAAGGAYASTVDPATGLQVEGRAPSGDFGFLTQWAGSGGSLGQETYERGYTDTAKNWYTGANQQGVNNGWDSDFYRDFIAGQNKAAEAGTLKTYFEDGGTGVVLWDHDSARPGNDTHFRFGDIYVAGEKQGNIYDQFDAPTANVMMGDFLFDGKKKAEIYSSSDYESRLNDEINAQRDYNAEHYEDQIDALNYNDKIQQGAEHIESSTTDQALLIGGATAGGALTWGGAGAALSAWAGPGALIGFAGGALLGGATSFVGALLNRDSLSYQASRAYNITATSWAENGMAAGLATGVTQWGGFAGSQALGGGLQNVTQGIADAQMGEVGDGQASFYNVDRKTGRPNTPFWWKALNFGAMAVDMGVQLASPVGKAIYMTQMSTQVGGEIAELGLTGGEQFDLSRGRFNNIFTDEHGNFDAFSAAAGIGNIGIDAVQMFTVKGLASTVDSARALAGTTSRAYGLPAWAGRGGSAAEDAMNRALLKIPGGFEIGTVRYGGWSAEQKALLRQGRDVATVQDVGGFKYVVKADGTVEGSRRASMSLLAPSEMLSSLSTRVEALRMREWKWGALRTDDYYQAALRLSAGQQKLQVALATAFGEGLEEVAQAYLEPWSFNNSPEFSDVVNSFIGGAMGGLGMGFGMNSRTPNADMKMYGLAASAHFARTGGEILTPEMWLAMSPQEKRAAAAVSDIDHSVLQAAFDRFSRSQAMGVNAGVVGANKLLDAYRSELNRALANIAPAVDGSFVVVQTEAASDIDADGNLAPGSLPADAVVSSGTQLAYNLVMRLRGISEQLKQVNKDLAWLRTQEASADIEARIVAEERNAKVIENTLKWGRELEALVATSVERMYGAGVDRQAVAAEVQLLNELMRDAFHERTDSIAGVVLNAEDKRALAHAATALYTRYPQDQQGSFQALVPQVSLALTLEGKFGDNQLQISNAILPALRADHDGDRLSAQNLLILDEQQYIDARSGDYFLGAGTSVNMKTPKYQEAQMKMLSDSMNGSNTALANFANGTLVDIGVQIKTRYTGVVPMRVLDKVLTDFYDAAQTNTSDAREALVDGLAKEAGAQLTEFSRKNLENEWLWVDNVIRAKLQQFQEGYAAHRPVPMPNTNNTVLPEKRTRKVKEKRAADAAVPGITLAIKTLGLSMFRKFQKLHYTSYTSTASEEWARHFPGEGPMTLKEQSELYAAIGTGITRSELDEVHGKDDITKRVLVQLQGMAMAAMEEYPGLGLYDAMLLIANMEVTALKVDEYGRTLMEAEHGSPRITFLQQLLKQSVMEDRRQKDKIFDASPELQAKHNYLLNMCKPRSNVEGSKTNPQRAFVQVFGAMQMYTLLGSVSEAIPFGPHLTVEQFIREYSSKPEWERADIDSQLHHESAYLGRSDTANMPFKLSEVLNKDGKPQVSPFRSLVDSVLAVGHDRIAMDTKGHAVGELGRMSDDISAAFIDFHTSARDAIVKWTKLNNSVDAGSAAAIQRLLEANPGFAKKLYALIPNSAANAVLVRRGDTVMAANWLYEMLAMENPKAAEMHYYRNITLADWNSLKSSSSYEEDEEFEVKGREYYRCKKRIHQVMMRLYAGQNLALKQKFFENLHKMESVDEFLGWVNTQPGLRAEEPPLTAWVDETAAFDKDKAQGGWSTELSGSEIRLAVKDLQSGSHNLVTDIAEEEKSIEMDKHELSGLKRYIKFRAGVKNVKLQQGDEDLYFRMQKRIDEAAEMRMRLGPAAMVFQTTYAALGFYARAHTKGINPPHVELMGLFDALRDADDFTVNYERVMASLTSHNLDAISNGLARTAAEDGRTMDDHGRVIEWTKPTIEQMVELLSKADTRPMARGILFPQVMERGPDGLPRTQLLTGKDLKSLLNGDHYDQMYTDTAELADVTQDKSLRYCAMLEATIDSKYGGHFNVSRYANELVISRLSRADHVLDYDEIHAMVLRAYREIALNVQQASTLVAQAGDDGGPDKLRTLYEETKRTAQQASRERQFGKGDLDQRTADVLAMANFEEWKQEKTAEKNALQTKISALDMTKPAQQAEKLKLITQRDAIDEEIKVFADRHALLMSDDMAKEIYTTWGYDQTWGEARKADRQKFLTEWLAENQRIVQHLGNQGFLALNAKLSAQLMNRSAEGEIDLEESEWEQVANSVVGMVMGEAVLTPGVGPIPPYPNADKEDERRFWDTSFSYLAELLNPDGPFVKGGIDIHGKAGRLGDTIHTDEMIQTIGSTIFDQKSLGRWTPDLPRAISESNSRIDACAAAPAMAIAGNAPKRQAVINAATERTIRIPPESMLSVSQLDVTQVMGLGDFDDLPVWLAGMNRDTEPPVMRPRAMMNNRFAKSVVLQYVDPATGETKEYDLLANDQNLARPHAKIPEVRDSGYFGIHMGRLREAFTRATTDPTMPNLHNPVGVRIEYFHPETALTDADAADVEKNGTWYNNIYFEGTSFKLDADTSASLLSTAWFTAGGISPVEQAAAIEATKKAQKAMQRVTVTSANRRKEIEMGPTGARYPAWQVDFAKMLREKVEILMRAPVGTGKLDIEFYNVAHKDMKMRHFVRGKNAQGEIELWDAEKVMRHQYLNPPTVDSEGNLVPAPLPLADAELYIPSDDVLRSMLMEQGNQGVARVFADQVEVDLWKVPRYTGASTTMVERFKSGLENTVGTLADTRVMGRARQTTHQVRPYQTDVQRSAYTARMNYLASFENEIGNARVEYTGGRTPGRAGFDPLFNMRQAFNHAGTALLNEDIQIDWEGDVATFVDTRGTKSTLASQLAIHHLERTLMQNKGTRTGWIYREGGKELPPNGYLTKHTLFNEDERDTAMSVSPGDLVVMELDSFEGSIDLMKERAAWFVRRGANIVLGHQDGTTWGRPEVAKFLGEIGYTKAMGAEHLYMPVDMTSRYQNVKARISSLTAVHGIPKRGRTPVLYVEGLPVEEGTLFVDLTDPNLPSVKVQLDLVPVDAYAGYNVPVTPEQINQVVAHLSGDDAGGMNTAEGRALLCEMSNGWMKTEDPKDAWNDAKLKKERDEADRELLAAYDRMLARFNQHPGEVLPQYDDDFGTGDLIPLIETRNDGKPKVLLYRHGYRGPQVRQTKSQKNQPYHLDEMLKMSVEGDDVAMNVAVYNSQRQPNASTHTGKVIRTNPRSGFGLSIEMDIPLSVLGDKAVLEWGGMKYTLVQMPDWISLPSHGIGRTTKIGGIASLPDIDSKEAPEGVCFSHGPTFSHFGWNFTKDFADAMGCDAATAIDILSEFAAKVNDTDIEDAGLFLATSRLNASMLEKMQATVDKFAGKADPSWAERAANPSNVSEQILMAAMVYLSTPGAELSHILKGGSFFDDTTSIDNEMRNFPSLFASYFDNAPYGSDLRVNINKRFNDILYNPYGDGTGYVLMENFRLLVINGRRNEDLPYATLNPGDAAQTTAFEGYTQPMYHGTSTEGGLPDRLEPLGVNAVINSNIAGPGFYTTSDLSIAKSYSNLNAWRVVEPSDISAGLMYQVLGTISGKSQKVFDLMAAPTAEDIAALPGALRQWLIDHGIDPNITKHKLGLNLWDTQIAKYGPDSSLGENTWFQMLGMFEGVDFDNVQVQTFVTKYLMDHYGVEALRYDGGKLMGGVNHDVVVSLKPDDLVIAKVDADGKLVESLTSLNQTGQPHITIVGNPAKNVEGYLGFPALESSGDNAVTNGMVFDPYGRQAVSQHVADTAYLAIGARTPLPRGIDRLQDFAAAKGIDRFEAGELDGGAWRMLNDIATDQMVPWRQMTQGERRRHSRARDAVLQFRTPLTFDAAHDWTSEKELEYKQAAGEILNVLGLDASQTVFVDYWVRQVLGAAKGTNKEGEAVGWIRPDGVMQAVQHIRWNVDRKYFPTVAGEVPLMHVHDVQLIHRLNKTKPDAQKWAPRDSIGVKADPANSWDEWVETSLGGALLSQDRFDSFYLLALDGFMHSYQNATTAMIDMPVSMDALKTAQLLDPATEEMIVSWERHTNLLAKDPILLETTKATLDDIIGGSVTTTGLAAQVAPASEIAKRRKRIQEWRKETGTPMPVPQTMKDIRKNGAEMIDKATSSNALYRIMINLRLGTALINPALYISMGPEQWVRGSLDRLANTITGQGTVGATSRLHAQATDRTNRRAEAKTQKAVKVLEDRLQTELTKITGNTEEAQAKRDELTRQYRADITQRQMRGNWRENVGLASRYTMEDREGLQRLYKTMGSRTDFQAMIYKQLMYQRPTPEYGPSLIERGSEKYAAAGTKWQDPTHGMRTTTLARRYLEAALQHIAATPTVHPITIPQLIAVMNTDPLWLQKNFPMAHLAGTNAIAQIRSLKATPLSLALRGIYEPLSESPNQIYSFLGNIVFKIPLLFSGYSMNVLTTITGMQGFSDMAAMFLHGRKKGPNSVIGRMQASIAGKNMDDDDARFDMSSVLEGLDLTRSFVRGGLTMTGLFALGTLAGGLNLTGEDDEAKKRRLQSKYQGVPYVHDPYAAANDWRNSDAIFMGNLPLGLGSMYPGFQHMHWMLKQFISPIVGIARWQETGDFNQVRWGFEDAVGSFPLINFPMWDDAVHTGAELAGLADRQAARDDQPGWFNGFGLLNNTVGVYEKMMLENSFVNAWYVGRDEYDRDPYTYPLTDSDGTLQREIDGAARAQNISVEQYIVENRDKLTQEIAGGRWKGELYIDPVTGDIKEAYLKRPEADAQLHSLTEGRATLAFLTNLFTGHPIGGDYWRTNMPKKQVEIDKPKLTQDEIEALLLSEWDWEGRGVPEMSQMEIAAKIKNIYKANGKFYDEAVVEAMAAEEFKRQKMAPLSMIIDDKEYLTKPGVDAIYRGLTHGLVHFGDAALAGVFISKGMREAIQKEWTDEIMQQSIDLGLDQTQAYYRWRRLWYGPPEDPTVPGLSEILWNDKISYQPTLRFDQLNTTYTMGPDGYPWATGFERGGLMSAIGLPNAWFQGQASSGQNILSTDDRYNTTYLGGAPGLPGLNTGLRALQLHDESWDIPTDLEIKKMGDANAAAAQSKTYTPSKPYHYTPYRRYGHYGGYGGGGGGGYPNFQRMYELPYGRAPYGHDVGWVSADSPLIRRADIHRERVWSERGRLKQWQ